MHQPMPTPLSVWRDAQGVLYIVLGIACDPAGLAHGADRRVVYWSTAHGCLLHMAADEFGDGRFTPVAAANGQEAATTW